MLEVRGEGRGHLELQAAEVFSELGGAGGWRWFGVGEGVVDPSLDVVDVGMVGRGELVVVGGRDVVGVQAGEFFFFLARQRCVIWGGQVVVWVCGRVGGGDHVDGVGDPAGVLVGGDGSAVGVGVGELLGGQVKQVARCPPFGVGGGDCGDQAGPGWVGGDGFGDGGAEHGVQVADPWWADLRVGGVQGGGVADLGGQSPPQGGGGQFVGQRAFGGRVDDQVREVGATGCGLGEVLGQLWPEAVGADARVDGVDELAESCDCGASASDGVYRGVLQEALDGARPRRILVGADEATVLRGHSVRGTEHGDFGGQLRCRSDEGFSPCGCGGWRPGACGAANVGRPVR